MDNIYELYSVSRSIGIKTHWMINDVDGQTLSSKHMDTEEALRKIAQAKEDGLTVLKLPIDCDSDYYDKYIVF